MNDYGLTTPASLPASTSPVTRRSFSDWDILLLVMFGISLALLIRTILRGYSLAILRRHSTLVHSVGFRVYHLPREMLPFSFGNAIYVFPSLHPVDEYRDIIRHEWAHVRQFHTLDMLLAEAVIIVNWYNPFAWLIRRAIRQNLEFIADKEILDNGRDKKEYQYSLLKTMGLPNGLVNPFGISFLKRRIVMMNRRPSPTLQLLKLSGILPILLVLLLSFRHHHLPYRPYPQAYFQKKHHNTTGRSRINVAGIVLDPVTFQPLAGVEVLEQTSQQRRVTDANGFYNLQVPVYGKMPELEFVLSQKGYSPSSKNEVLWEPDTVEGHIYIDVLNRVTTPMEGAFIQDPAYSSPVDPGYADARAIMGKVVRDDKETMRFWAMQKAHPEISLFYVTNDERRRYVLYRDGRVETYGGPGNPGFAEMDARYGPLPWYMVRRHDYYPPAAENPWQDIADRLQHDFRPERGDAKAIVFTGDERIIVIPASGQAEFYGMLNIDEMPNNRSAFEARFGKLPDYTPVAVHVPHQTYYDIVFPSAQNP
jgi:hypothetical protein